MFTAARPVLPSRVRASARQAALACALLALVPASAAAEWRRLDSPNFIVVGEAGERDLGRIAAQFESFREALGRVLSPRATATAVPTVVVVFSNDRAFAPYKPLYRGKPIDSAGTFHADRDFNFITILNDGRPGGMRVVFHEYAHVVTANLAANLPAWLNEGLAEYYSTFEIERGGREATIGRPIESHLRLLATSRLLPIEDLIRVERSSTLYNEGERRSVFYAQSWALTHMLLMGDPSRSADLSAFIGHINDGMPDASAWQAAFGRAPIQRDLDGYLRRRAFRVNRYTFEDRLTSLETASTPMAAADVGAMLAALYLRQRRYEDAQRLAGDVVQASPGHAHANAVLARVDVERGDLTSATKRLEAAGSIDDWFVAYTTGVTLADVVSRSDARAAPVGTARERLETLQRQREIPNVYAHLAMLELSSPAGAAAQAQAHIARARGLAPGREDYALIEARALADLGDFDSARRILDAMMRPGYPAHIRDTARMWLDNVSKMESSRRRGIPRTTAGYRARLPGEERMEGVLERVTCLAAAPAQFRVRTETGIETLFAPDFGAVQFITYRRDLRGKVICGPLDEPLPVYVTWKHGGDRDTRIVVAVEFLPQR